MGFGIGIVPWMARVLSTKFVSVRLQKPQYTADGRLIGIGAIAEVKWTDILAAFKFVDRLLRKFKSA